MLYKNLPKDIILNILHYFDQCLKHNILDKYIVNVRCIDKISHYRIAELYRRRILGRMHHEMATLTTLKHENIIQLHGQYVDATKIHLVNEYYDTHCEKITDSSYYSNRKM